MAAEGGVLLAPHDADGPGGRGGPEVDTGRKGSGGRPWELRMGWKFSVSRALRGEGEGVVKMARTSKK